jgi:hypothetical protein
MTIQPMTHELSAAGLNAFKPRVLHTAYFVADIERSLKFYRDVWDDSPKCGRTSPMGNAR